MWICPVCDEEHEDNFDTCWKCNYCLNDNNEELLISKEELFNEADEFYKENNFEDAIKLYKKIVCIFPYSVEADYAKLYIRSIENSIIVSRKNIRLDFPITLTTANNLEGYFVRQTIEIISAECSYGINILHDMFTSVTDAFGGRSNIIEKTLRDARKICLGKLKQEAFEVGANAVIAVNFSYSEFTGKGKSMLFLVATGTAVVVEKN